MDQCARCAPLSKCESDLSSHGPSDCVRRRLRRPGAPAHPTGPDEDPLRTFGRRDALDTATALTLLLIFRPNIKNCV